jgi:hypothetical protein
MTVGRCACRSFGYSSEKISAQPEMTKNHSLMCARSKNVGFVWGSTASCSPCSSAP